MALPNPKISIVIPNFNHAHELKYSLRAIMSQSRPADEVVIIDDGSTDNSIEVIRSFSNKFASIKLIQNAERTGVVSAVNSGIAKASCEFVILASADERIMPDMCEMMEQAYMKFPDALLYASKFTEWQPETSDLKHGDRGEYNFWFTENQEPEWVSAEKIQTLMQIDHVRLTANSAMFKRSAMIEMGGFAPELRWYSDFFLIYGIALRHGFCAVPLSLSWFKVAAGSYSSVGTSNKSEQNLVVESFLKKLDEDSFSDIRDRFFDAPASMAAFLRPLLCYLFMQPARYGLLARLAIWWLKDTIRGNRPGIWANTRIAKNLRRKHLAKSLRKLGMES